MFRTLGEVTTTGWPATRISAVAISVFWIAVCGGRLSAEPSSPQIRSSDHSAAEALAAGVVQLRLDPTMDRGLRLPGPDARLQLLVTGQKSAGAEVDLTRDVSWQVKPAGIVEIDATGLAIPLADGEVQVTATSGTLQASTTIVVEDFAATRLVDFQNQIVPIFTKLSCNSGGCHGKSSGQNGFRLSLLGFYPEEDYEYLVKEGRGRRIFPAAPEMSLLLTKPVGDVPHGGGKRLEKESQEYYRLVRWIRQGCPPQAPNAPTVTSIRCLPESRVMAHHSTQQLTVLARFSDGSVADVTRMALYEPNDAELAASSLTGLVSVQDLSGEVAVMIRYQEQVATFRATIPMGAEVPTLPEQRNLIDEAVFAQLKQLGIPPSPICDDATFIRRVTLDITGGLPSKEDVRQFLDETSTDKRDRLVDRLLESPGYADNFANKWNLLLRNRCRQDLDQEGTYEFYQWIWSSMYENKPYDRFVSEIVTASGDPQWNPPVVWYREVSDVEQQAEDTAQLFLGMKIQCARCHHHPYERWSQDDYYGLAAFFSRVGRKELGAEVAQNSRDRRIFHREGIAELPNPRTRQNLRPASLGGAALEIPPDRDPRIFLAAWISDPHNPFFARSLVNRYWKHFFNRGIVEPEDDMRETNPPCNPELLDRLSVSFAASEFNLKALVRLICQSSTYQLSSEPNAYNLKDKQSFSRFYPKRMSAECLYDSFHQVTDATTQLPGLPRGGRALQLPDVSVSPYFLKVFGQPQGNSACECERSQSANLAQSLHLLNSQEVQAKISSPQGRARQLASETGRSHAERIEDLYLMAYSRRPEPEELQAALAHLERHKDQPQAAYEDFIWALVNTKEFLFNH